MHTECGKGSAREGSCKQDLDFIGIMANEADWRAICRKPKTRCQCHRFFPWLQTRPTRAWWASASGKLLQEVCLRLRSQAPLPLAAPCRGQSKTLVLKIQRRR